MENRAAAPLKLPAELAEHPQFEVLRELGRGGMGVVYLARNRLMGRLEVLKVVNERVLDRSGGKERFLREIQAAARLSHPNVVTAYSAIQLGELLVFAMEYVEGEDLAKFVQRIGPLPVPAACYYARQAALGLQHAFERGMVHRDIKPQNLILFRDGPNHVVKVLDFGLAKVASGEQGEHGITGSGKMLGTPDYVAPEQTLDAARADIRADIYSLGCTLYFLLSGGPPFKGSLFEVLLAHQSTEARALNLARPEVPEELAVVVCRLMAKDPARRCQTPAEVAQALVPFIKVEAKGTTAVVDPAAQETVTSATPSPATTADTAVARERSWVASPLPKQQRRIVAGVLAGVALAGLVAVWADGGRKVGTKGGTHAVPLSEPDPEGNVDGGSAGGAKPEIAVKPDTSKAVTEKSGAAAVGGDVGVVKGANEPMMPKPGGVPAPLQQKAGRANAAPLPAPKPGINELKQAEADLQLLNYAKHPKRDTQRKHALQEVRSAVGAIRAGKMIAEVQWHLREAQKEIIALQDVSTSAGNKRALEAARRNVEDVMKIPKARGQGAPAPGP